MLTDNLHFDLQSLKNKLISKLKFVFVKSFFIFTNLAGTRQILFWFS